MRTSKALIGADMHLSARSEDPLPLCRIGVRWGLDVKGRGGAVGKTYGCPICLIVFLAWYSPRFSIACAEQSEAEPVASADPDQLLNLGPAANG